MFKSLANELIKTPRHGGNTFRIHHIPLAPRHRFDKADALFSHGKGCGGKTIGFIHIVGNHGQTYDTMFRGFLLVRVVDMPAAQIGARRCDAFTREIEDLDDLLCIKRVFKIGKEIVILNNLFNIFN